MSASRRASLAVTERGCSLQSQLPLVLARRDDVVTAVRSAGYRYVTLDLEGFRSGNLNGALGVVPGTP